MGPTDKEIHGAVYALVRSGFLEVGRWVEDEFICADGIADEMLPEIEKHSTATAFSMRIRAGVMAAIEARERAKWIEIRNTDAE